MGYETFDQKALLMGMTKLNAFGYISERLGNGWGFNDRTLLELSMYLLKRVPKYWVLIS